MITAMDTNPVFKRRLFSKRPGMFFSLLLSVSVLALPACDDDEDKMPEEKTIVEANASLDAAQERSEEHTSELQSLMRISYAAFCLNKKQQERRSNQHTAGYRDQL